MSIYFVCLNRVMMVKVFFCRKRKERRKKPGNSREKHHEKIICLSERLPPPVGSRAAVQAAGSPDGSVRADRCRESD